MKTIQGVGKDGANDMMNHRATMLPLLLWIPISAFAVDEAVDASAGVANPHSLSDESQVVLSGNLSEVRGSDFHLDYGKGEVLVELVNWERQPSELGLREGLQVTVYGEIDTDFFTATTVEAEVVYLKQTNTYFYATSDETLKSAYQKAHEWSEPNYYQISDMTLRGTVSSTRPGEGMFTITMNSGSEIIVDTEALGYDPLSSESLNPIDKGDAVRVSGRIDYAFFEGKVLVANTVTTLR